MRGSWEVEYVPQALAAASSGAVVLAGDLARGCHRRSYQQHGSPSVGFGVHRRQSLPLAGITVLLIMGVMVWQHRTEKRLALPPRPDWTSDRSPYPGLEAFTEQDPAVFFGREAETTELLERLHPVVIGQADRLVAVVGPSGAGKSSLVQAGVIPRLRHRRSGRGTDHPLRTN